MALSNTKSSEQAAYRQVLPESYADYAHLNSSTVSWAAIFAGATAAAALSLILLFLGAGLGLSSVSPWVNKGVSATTFGVSTIIWITVTQILASGMGGYLAGRLRTKWANAAADEVYFRDTAHGFLAWAVATLATAALLTSTISGIVSGGAQAAASLTGGAAAVVTAAGAGAGVAGSATDSSDAANQKGVLAYYVDSLFRRDGNGTDQQNRTKTTPVDPTQKAEITAEVTRIFTNAMRAKSLSSEDLSHISQLVAKNTGLSQQEAEQRVSDIYNTMQNKVREAEIAAKNAADKARKASMYLTLWLFISLLVGAFSASLSATWGGRCRDE